MNDTRSLIVNADDFGLSPGVDEGVIAAHERGIVSSASLMVRWPAAVEAALSARDHPELGLGLHIDLSEREYRDGAWLCGYQVVDLKDQSAVADEVARQLDAFRRLVGRNPTHLDSHQHVHRKEPVKSILIERARALAVPLRHFSSSVGYRGDFYGQTATGVALPGAVSAERLIAVLKSLTPGITELGCHPGLRCDLVSIYNRERAEEVKALCDPRVRETVAAEGIILRNFSGLLSRAG
jgi:chitin disaccharide deacetylase